MEVFAKNLLFKLSPTSKTKPQVSAKQNPMSMEGHRSINLSRCNIHRLNAASAQFVI